jgi:hypothetical protein
MGKLDQLVGGAKTWMSPGEIPDTLKAVFSPDAWKAAPMALIGFLLVPAAVLAVVLGMGAAKRRRAKNPRRKRAVARRSRRRVANPRRRGRRRNPAQKKLRGSPTKRWVRRMTVRDVPGMDKSRQKRRSSRPGKRSRSRGTHGR